jgi:RNA polymerase sigma-70 factor (ECF subfamily)
VARHQRRVLALARRVTKNEEDAEDVAQESFRKAFLHLRAFEEKSRFCTWLTRIALNESYMLLRRKRRSPEILTEHCDDDVNCVTQAIADRSPGPEEFCGRRERYDLLMGAINRLRPKLRRTILLHVVEELSMEEMARMLGISIAAVKSRLARGRRMLCGEVNLGSWRTMFAGRPRKGVVSRSAVSML